MYKPQKILVSVDLSSCSKAALAHALGLAKELGATVHVLYVVEEPAAFHREARGTAQLELDTFLSDLSTSQRVQIETFVDAGSPRERILARAKSEGYDLLVMGTHGRTGRPHALVGSVTESVVRMAPCPVLTVRDGIESRH